MQSVAAARKPLREAMRVVHAAPENKEPAGQTTHKVVILEELNSSGGMVPEKWLLLKTLAMEASAQAVSMHILQTSIMQVRIMSKAHARQARTVVSKMSKSFQESLGSCL
jgi:hypothetical protein